MFIGIRHLHVFHVFGHSYKCTYDVLLLFQPETLTMVLEYCNLFFSCLFAVEMLLKIIADGMFGYIKNGFNVFDGSIVILR